MGPFSLVMSTSGTNTFTLPFHKGLVSVRNFKHELIFQLRTSAMDENAPPTTDQRATARRGATPDDAEDLGSFRLQTREPLHSIAVGDRRCAALDVNTQGSTRRRHSDVQRNANVARTC